jgi:phosphoheptose isomerase
MGLTMAALAGFDGGEIAGLADRRITVRPGMYEQVEDAYGVILYMIVSALGRP